MQDPDGHFWTTDPDLFAALPGGQSVIDWFGFVPSFHDAKLARLEIGGGSASLKIEAFRMTDKVDAKGYFVLDRHAVVALDLIEVTGASLIGDADSNIFELGIRRITSTPGDWQTCEGPKPGDYEVGLESSYGLAGSIFARELRLSLTSREP